MFCVGLALENVQFREVDKLHFDLIVVDKDGVFLDVISVGKREDLPLSVNFSEDRGRFSVEVRRYLHALLFQHNEYIRSK